MNRLEWILGILLVVLLGVVAVLAVMFWIRPDASGPPANSATAIAQRANAIAPTPPFAGQTAKVAYAAALQKAQEWHDDAILVNASATWPQGTSQQDLLAGTTTWGFSFYSPQAASLATISVVDNQASLVSETAHQQPAPPLEASGWNLDSRDAIQQFLSEGGVNFIGNNGITTLTAMLSLDNPNNRIEWLLSLFATQTERSFTMRIDATSGEVLEIEEAP